MLELNLIRSASNDKQHMYIVHQYTTLWLSAVKFKGRDFVSPAYFLKPGA